MTDAIEQGLAPITVRVATAVRLTGLSWSRIYELIQAGDIEIVKVGRVTLVRYDSLQRPSDWARITCPFSDHLKHGLAKLVASLEESS